MARRRFRIFGKGAGDEHGGSGEPEPAAEPGAPPAASTVDSDAREWTVGEDPAGPAAAASAPEEGAEALLPPDLRANGTSASTGAAPDAAEWLLRGHEAGQPARVAPEAKVASEAGAPPAAERPIEKAPAVEEDVEKATRPATERLAAVEKRLAKAARRADRAEERLIAAGRAADERLKRVAEAQRELEEATERARQDEGVESTSIAEMAAAAESLASDSEPASAAEPELEPPSWVAVDPKPAARSESEPEAEANSAAAPEPEPVAEPEPQRRSPPAVEPDQAGEGMVSLSLAELKELRELGMSVTQAKRVIRYREERNGFRTLDELDQVPGFPRTFLSGVKERLVP